MKHRDDEFDAEDTSVVVPYDELKLGRVEVADTGEES